MRSGSIELRGLQILVIILCVSIPYKNVFHIAKFFVDVIIILFNKII